MWPISGDRWIVVSADGTLIDVPFDHLVALRDVIGKQSHPGRLSKSTSWSFLSVMTASATGYVRDKRLLLL